MSQCQTPPDPSGSNVLQATSYGVSPRAGVPMPLLMLLGLLAALPLTIPSSWVSLAYRGIPPNTLEISSEGLRIRVDRSAGPIVHRLAQPVTVAGLRARGRIIGTLATDAVRQGTPGQDDFALRIGLVEAGTRRPTFVQRRLSPAWVRHLFSLAPPGAGVSQIRFFNLGLQSSQIGWSRRHPLSELLSEEVVAAPNGDGRFDFIVETAPLEALGIWLAADGDDTGSTFEVALEHLSLIPAS